MLPAAPALFSTTTGCPRLAVSCSVTRRAVKSVVPPGALGTISVMGRSGYLPCAIALPVTAQSARVVASIERVSRFIVVSMAFGG